MEVTLVVMIDDLDRCLPATAIATLEAVRLFLFIRRTAFVIAADDRMIREAVRVHFHGVSLDDALVTNYFDKLIQIPIRVPPLGTQDVRAYMMLLFVQNSSLTPEIKEKVREQVCLQLSESWKGKRVDLRLMDELISDCPDDLHENLELADRLAPLMTKANQIAGNPRLIKRFLNTLSIRISIAKTQGVTMDESALAKMVLFERCGEEAAYTDLISKINNSEDGKPTFLSEWESLASTGELGDNMPNAWSSDFAKEWLALEPALAEMDMRSIVYISREHMPIVTASDQLSTEAAGILEALAILERRSQTLRDRVASLPGREISLLLNRLMVRARHEQTWGTPPVFFALQTIADADETKAQVFLDFLKRLLPDQIRPDIVPALADSDWAKPVYEKWESDPKVTKSVKTAIEQIRKEV